MSDIPAACHAPEPLAGETASNPAVGFGTARGTPAESQRAKRSYNRRVPLSEIAARRTAARQFKSERGYIWQKRSAAWKKVCTKFLPLGFVISPDGLTAALDVLLPDGNTVTLPAASVTEDGTERLEQWAAFYLIDMPEPRAAGFWLRSVIPDLRGVRTLPLRYVEDEERSSRHLMLIAEKVIGRTVRPPQ